MRPVVWFSPSYYELPVLEHSSLLQIAVSGRFGRVAPKFRAAVRTFYVQVIVGTQLGSLLDRTRRFSTAI